MFNYIYNEEKEQDEIYLNGTLFRYRDEENRNFPGAWKYGPLSLHQAEGKLPPTLLFPDLNHEQFSRTTDFLSSFAFYQLKIDSKIDSIESSDSAKKTISDLNANLQWYRSEISGLSLSLVAQRIVLLTELESRVRDENKKMNPEQSDEELMFFEDELDKHMENELNKIIEPLREQCSSMGIPSLFGPINIDLKRLIKSSNSPFSESYVLKKMD